ncbi:hypothetical protein ACFW04_013851 [Cataglyphis niger]
MDGNEQLIRESDSSSSTLSDDWLYLDRDLLRNMSSKLDIMLMNQRRILNEIFPGEAIIERPENCSPRLPLRDEKSFEAFNNCLKYKIAYSQFVNATKLSEYNYLCLL